MNRMLFPALILATPVAAHTDTQIHAHGTDYTSVGVSLALVAMAVIALIAKLPK